MAGIEANPSSRYIVLSVESAEYLLCAGARLGPKTRPYTTGEEKFPPLRRSPPRAGVEWGGVGWYRGLGIQAESIKTDT